MSFNNSITGCYGLKLLGDNKLKLGQIDSEWNETNVAVIEQYGEFLIGFVLILDIVVPCKWYKSSGKVVKDVFCNYEKLIKTVPNLELVIPEFIKNFSNGRYPLLLKTENGIYLAHGFDYNELMFLDSESRNIAFYKEVVAYRFVDESVTNGFVETGFKNE